MEHMTIGKIILLEELLGSLHFGKNIDKVWLCMHVLQRVASDNNSPGMTVKHFFRCLWVEEACPQIDKFGDKYSPQISLECDQHYKEI